MYVNTYICNNCNNISSRTQLVKIPKVKLTSRLPVNCYNFIIVTTSHAHASIFVTIVTIVRCLYVCNNCNNSTSLNTQHHQNVALPFRN